MCGLTLCRSWNIIILLLAKADHFWAIAYFRRSSCWQYTYKFRVVKQFIVSDWRQIPPNDQQSLPVRLCWLDHSLRRLTVSRPRSFSLKVYVSYSLVIASNYLRNGAIWLQFSSEVDTENISMRFFALTHAASMHRFYFFYIQPYIIAFFCIMLTSWAIEKVLACRPR